MSKDIDCAPIDFTSEKPSHPGEIISILFLPAQHLTVRDFAALLGATLDRTDALLNQRANFQVEEIARLYTRYPDVAEMIMQVQIDRDFFDEKARRPTNHERQNLYPSICMPTGP